MPCGPTSGGAGTTPTTGAATCAGFAEFFFGEVFPEPHSSKQIDDAVEWTLQTDAETLIATSARRTWVTAGPGRGEPDATRRRPLVRCPALVVHGDDDRIVTVRTAATLAARSAARSR